jgi:sugar O-acyltransferase (sialic acid O-acetyltransferase NeuD family)
MRADWDRNVHERVAIWGAAGHAKVVADAMRRTPGLEVIGFIDDTAPQRRGEPFCGGLVLGGRELLPGLLRDGVSLMLAFGHNAARLALGEDLQAMGFRFPVVVHPAAVLSPDCVVGAGTFVGAGAILQADSKVGAHAIINTAAVVEHDCSVGDGVHLGPRVTLSGRVSVGRGTWLGTGAVVRDGVTIGERSIVGMGSVVRHDVPDGVVAYGCPARVVRQLVRNGN